MLHNMVFRKLPYLALVVPLAVLAWIAHDFLTPIHRGRDNPNTPDFLVFAVEGGIATSTVIVFDMPDRTEVWAYDLPTGLSGFNAKLSKNNLRWVDVPYDMGNFDPGRITAVDLRNDVQPGQTWARLFTANKHIEIESLSMDDDNGDPLYYPISTVP